MFTTVERMLAIRYLRSRKRDGFISVTAGFSLVGIALGVATLIVVMSVMNGFRHELFQRILGADGHIAVMASEGDGLKGYELLADQLSVRPQVQSVIAMVDGQAMLVADNLTTGAMVRGLSADNLRKKEVFSKHIPQAMLDAFDQEGGVIIGHRLMKRLNLVQGDKLTMLSPAARASILGSMPRLKEFAILGSFDTGMYEYDNNLVLMPLAVAQRFFGQQAGGEPRVSLLELMVDKPFDATVIAARLEPFLPNNTYALDWRRRHFHITNALQVERNVMFLILSLIIMVAAFNIISSLIMLVKDKEADIAILRTMGASRRTILRIFFLTGSSIGIIGTIAGVVLGLSFAANIDAIKELLESISGGELFSAEIYFLSTLPARTEITEVVQVAVIALVITFLATLYPALRAARMEPAASLKLSG